ncbi:MAG: DUF1302 family protein, partial [Oleiphilaceae bacterium]|nr:DUF1302 family protein [Oleiphilaceae bacterium]
RGPNGEVLSKLEQQRLEEAGGANANLAGKAVDGYDRFKVSQLQMTFLKFFDRFMGASRMTFVGEIGATYVHGLPDQSEARFGRSGNFGIGPLPVSGENFTGDVCAEAAGGEDQQNINASNCRSDGFTDSFSWGYVTRFVWEYNNVFAGVNLRPQLAFSHDVKGNAPQPGGNFIEDSKAIGLSVNATYLNQYSGSIGYTNFFDGKPFNELTDRDFVSASISYSF